MEFLDIYELPEARELADIEGQKSQLEQQLISDAFATPEIRGAYELACQQLGASAIELAANSELQGSYVSLGVEAYAGLEQLQPLESILSEEQLAPLKEQLARRIEQARAFFEKYGMHTEEAKEFIKRTGGELAARQTVEVRPVLIPAPEEEPTAVITASTESKPETSKINIALKLRKKMLMIGKQGRIVPLSQRHYDKQRDYSEYRLKALKTLVGRQGEELSPHEIWDEIGGGEPFDRSAMQQVRVWLVSLTYRKQPLICFNGKRGLGSRYSVSQRFELELLEDDESAERELVGSPLDRGDLYVAARHLADFNAILGANGIPAVSKQIEKALKEFRPDYSHIKGDVEAIRTSRVAALERVYGFLEDPEGFFEYLDSAYEKGADYEFVQYLFDLEEEQRKMIKQLMSAKIERTPIDINKYRLEAVDNRGRVIAYSEPSGHSPTPITQLVREDRGYTDAMPSLAEGEAEETAEPVDLEDLSAAPVDTESQDKKASTDLQKNGEKNVNGKGLTENEVAKLKLLETIAYSAAATFLERFHPEHLYSRPQIHNVFPKFSANRVATAKDNRVVAKKPHMTFSIEDVVRIFVYTDRDLQNVYTNRKYKKIVEEIIQSSIAKAKQESERVHSGGNHE